MTLFLSYVLVIACAVLQAQATATPEHAYDTEELMGFEVGNRESNDLSLQETNLENDLRSDIVVDIEADPFKDLALYAGMGYNALEANPESDYIAGGQDPGFRFATKIFTQTYELGSTAPYLDRSVEEPDQVEMLFGSSCYERNTTVAYNGQTSYRNELELSTEVEGGYDGIFTAMFSLSYGMQQVRSATDIQQRVVIQTNTVCNMGTIRYRTANALAGENRYTLTNEFKNSIRLLPLTYDAVQYTRFLDDWGTHFVETATIGYRKMTRSSLSYTEVFQYMMNSNSVGAGLELGYAGAKVSAKFDIKMVNEALTSSSELHKEVDIITMGSLQFPVPIKVRVKSIIYPIVEPLFEANEWSEIQQKRNNLDRALREYPVNKQAGLSDDPLMSVDITWPSGDFSLVEGVDGCPAGFASGYIEQYTGPLNSATPPGISDKLRMKINNDAVRTYYCSKTQDIGLSIPWPPGKYCIARRGGECPENFIDGHIFWDNSVAKRMLIQNPIPDKSAVTDTGIDFCCRSDGQASNKIFLPAAVAFGLYRYGGTCQQVNMATVHEYVVKYDTQNPPNDDSSCGGNHPDVESCTNDPQVHFCSYVPEHATVNISWPYGTYSLLAGKECPPGFQYGFIGQDTEDSSNQNTITPGSPENLRIDVNNEGVTTHYCTKTAIGNANTDGHWPAGKYCIAQYGGSCPSGFQSSSILWDDEDDRNRNSKQSTIPKTSSDLGNIRVYYCCRSDGNANTEIVLPRFTSFGLLRRGGTCQKVAGMTEMAYKIKFDDQNSGNDDTCFGSVRPDDDSCNNDHELWICAYQPGKP